MWYFFPVVTIWLHIIGAIQVGAKELNRRFIGIEKEVKYYDLAVARVFGQHCH